MNPELWGLIDWDSNGNLNHTEWLTLHNALRSGIAAVVWNGRDLCGRTSYALGDLALGGDGSFLTALDFSPTDPKT